MPAKKQTRRQLLVKELDDLVSQYVVMRDGRCVCCGSTSHLECGHYITRRKSILRFDDRNCNCQCRDCNLKHEHFPYVYEGYMRRNYGDRVLDELERMANINAWRWELYELEAFISVYKRKIEALRRPIYQEPREMYQQA
jgi:hypothetical protein